LDGNQHTGAFLLPEDRYNPQIAGILRDKPANIPIYLTLIAALGAGLFFLLECQKISRRTYYPGVYRHHLDCISAMITRLEPSVDSLPTAVNPTDPTGKDWD
jgi:hypothetical protein